MTESAFARVAAQTAPAAGNAGTNPLPFNGENPFGAPSDFKGGVFTPTPPMETLQGRTCVFIPRSFNPEAADPFNPGKTRKQWTVDLYVLDGGELRFWYKQKGQDGAAPTDVEQVVTDLSPDSPYTVLGMWVSQAAIVPKLSGVADNRQFLICTIERGAQKADRDKGATDASVREAHAAWVARGKTGPEPKSLWLAADLNAEQVAKVHQWWAGAKDSIKL